MRTPTTLLSILALAGLPLVACSDAGSKGTDGNDPRPDDTGEVDDDRARSATAGVVVSAEMSAAAEVRGSTVNEDGTTTPDEGAESQVEADGSFTLDVAADESLYLVQAFDANGEVIGAAMLESTGSEGSETTTTPIDPESTVEAMAWLQAVAEAGDKDGASYGDVRGRIDATLAATVYADWESGEGQDDMDALAAAVTAAQSAELWSYTEAGSDVSRDDVHDAELMLSSELSAQLYAWIQAGNDSTDEAEDAQADFMNDLYAYGTAELGLTADQTNDASANAGLAFAAVVESMQGPGDATTEGAWVAWGELQAYLTANATSDTYADSSASSSVMADVNAAADVFVEETDDAESVEGMSSAWADFYAETTGSIDSSLAATLELTLIQESAYDLALSSSRDARDAMMTSVMAAVSSETSSGFDYSGEGSAQVIASAVTDSRATYEQDVWDACLGLEDLSTGQLELMTSVVTTVDGSYAFAR